MKITGKLLALLLCLCLAASLLAGCSRVQPKPEETPAATEAPAPASTPEPTPEPTPALPDPGELYAQAAERLSAAELLCADTTITREILLPDYTSDESGATLTLTETTQRSAQYQGLGGKELLALVEEQLTLDGDVRAEQRQIYADGTLYLELNETRFYSQISQEDFLSRQLPILLLDASLYGALETVPTEAGYAVRFADPTAAEAWAMPEEAELLEASGEAGISPEGELTGAVYTLRYRFGGLTVTDRYEAGFQIPGELDLSGEVPGNTKDRESLDDAFAPLAVLRAGNLLERAGTVCFTQNMNVYIEAAGQAQRSYTTCAFLDRGTDYRMHMNESSTWMDYSSMQTSSSTTEMEYSHGKVKVSYDDGETDSYPVDASFIRDTIGVYPTRFFPDFRNLADAEMHEVGDYWLISFAGTADYGVQLKDTVCKSVFQEGYSTILDDHASAYATKTAEGFLAVEKISGLPTALNLSFSGVHTIEGIPCQLNMELNLKLSLYTEDAVKEIFDEPPVGAEPEQKPTPVFYRVSDEEGHVLYLLGTIHVGDNRTAFLPQVIYDALEAADALAVEFDDERFEESLDQDEELQASVMQAYYYTDGTGTQNHLDSEVYKQGMDLLKVSGGYNDTAESLKPFFWANSIELFYMSQGRELSSTKGVDARLMRLARAAEKEILDVESGQFQLNMLGGYTDPVQEMLLSETIEISRSTYLRSVRELYEAWCTGDEAALIERLAAMSEEDRASLDEDELAVYDEYHQKMEVERNANMVEKAREYLQSGRTVFCAVGLAHLLGEGGMVEALREAGYTVELIDTH